MTSFAPAARLLFVGALALLTACEESTSSAGADASKDETKLKAAQDAEAKPMSAGSPAAGPKKEVAAQNADSEPKPSAQDAPAFSCPEGSILVPGGSFWVGNPKPTYQNEENPFFKTSLPAFCVDTHEVSAALYEQCVAEGKCSASRGENLTCNSVAKGRGDHPINCIDFKQAEAVCAYRGMRLPTEVEWEYLGRSGEKMSSYPWGEAPPDEQTCWKHAGSCKVGSFPADQFGLYDVVGNVWEWTSSYFAPYPWPASSGRHRVYRGASWSRRFEKWLRPNLRNRLKESGMGSHLGVRCVASSPAECPYGKDEAGACLFGVDEAECLNGLLWNGARCAPPGESGCPEGVEFKPGRGCEKERVVGAVSHELDTASVERVRSPQFDADCKENTPAKPLAYRLTGGGHLARNQVGASLGCKNRDVGVGFNSACCPN